MRATTVIAVVAAALACAASISAVDDIGFLQFVGNMPSRRSDADAETIGDMILMTGGCDGEQVCQEVALSNTSYCSCTSITSNIEVYYPGNNTWATNALPNMPVARYRHNSIHYGRNLYVFGGRALDDTLLTSIDVLNLDTKVWSTVQPPASMLPLIGSDNAYWTVGENTFVFAGGYSQNYDTLNSTVIVTVDPKNATNITWSQGPQMPLTRGDFSAAAIDDTHTMLIGGFTQGDFCNPQRTTVIFDASSSNPAQWKYTSSPSMPVGGADQAVSYFEKSIYVFGGQTKDPACNSNFDNGSNNTVAYKIGSNTWEIQANLPLSLFRFASAPWTNGSVSFLYVIGGQENSTVANNTRYNPVANTVYRFVPSAVATKPNSAAVAAPAGAIAALVAAATALLAL